jgi:hypothetical protein
MPFECAQARGRGEKREAGGPRVGATRRAGTGKKRGPRHGGGTAGVASIGPWPAGAGGGVATRQWRGATADKWGRTTAAPGGQRVGAGGQGSAVRH